MSNNNKGTHKEMTKLAKGVLVKLNNKTCFTTKQGGDRRYPLTNYNNDDKGIVDSHRPTTLKDQSAWYESKRLEIETAKALGKDTFSISTDDAGESRLPPQAYYVALYRDRIYQVIRARCRVRLGWGNPTPGMAMILCTESGEETYIKRELLEVI